MTIERLLTPLFIAIAVCGLVIAVASFLPWVQFTGLAPEQPPSSGQLELSPTQIDLPGNETSRWRDIESINRNGPQSEDGWCSCRVDFGDGYFTAALGLMMVAAAGAAFAQRVREAAIVAGVAALAALGLSGFNAIADWQALAWTADVNLEAVNGTVQPALIVVVIAAAVSAVCAALAWSFERALELADEAEEDDWPDPDTMNAETHEHD